MVYAPIFGTFLMAAEIISTNLWYLHHITCSSPFFLGCPEVSQMRGQLTFKESREQLVASTYTQTHVLYISIIAHLTYSDSFNLVLSCSSRIWDSVLLSNLKHFQSRFGSFWIFNIYQQLLIFRILLFFWNCRSCFEGTGAGVSWNHQPEPLAHWRISSIASHNPISCFTNGAKISLSQNCPQRRPLYFSTFEVLQKAYFLFAIPIFQPCTNHPPIVNYWFQTPSFHHCPSSFQSCSPMFRHHPGNRGFQKPSFHEFPPFSSHFSWLPSGYLT